MDLFSNNKKRTDGKQTYCRDCNAAYRKATREETNQRRREHLALRKDEVNGVRRAQYQANPEPKKAAAKEYRQRNADLCRDRDRRRDQTPERIEWLQRYYETNRERISKRWAEYSAKHRERLNQNGRKWHAANRARSHKNFRRWQRANPERTRQRVAEYAQRRKQAEGNHTQAEWEAMLDWFGNKCLRCSAIEAITVDHVVPLIAGGSDGIENLQPLCAICNSAKRDKTLDYRSPIALIGFFGAATLSFG